MTISNEKVVTLTYELRVDNNKGDVVESVKVDKPFVFLYGAGTMLPKFEEHLKDLKAKDKFEFLLKCEDAYGKATEEAVMDLPKNIFEVEGKVEEGLLAEGNVIPMQNDDGNKFNGVIMEVGDENVKMDFNHPLAGDDLHFAGVVVEVRDASKEEIDHGHVH
ncbi:MAG: FKBP-type peptidyl-prolyl cis-trans isomerase [Bacteroidales bacterium]|jgi:FKBP-type peptidyl-prolyl cis-trans isomerase SlyD|nr:FKBP-type peptidyl-prolyl cis-trans isomerase [Bacteroidales bacterium]